MFDRPRRAAATKAQERQETQKASRKASRSKGGERASKAQKQNVKDSAPVKAEDGKKRDDKKLDDENASIDHDKRAPAEKKTSGGSSSPADVQKRIEKLLGNDIFALAYPPIEAGHGEVDMPDDASIKPKPSMPKDGGNDASEQRGYTSPDLSPFEQLICAMLLSKPISHRLGLRAIATILSAPFEMRTPSALLDQAGFEGRRAAMWEARTQHKEKTASQLGDAVRDLRKLCGAKKDHQDGNTEHDDAVIRLSPVLEAAQKAKDVESAAEAVRSTLAPNVKGLGPTGVDIFLRRVQGEEGWQDRLCPFMDSRTLGIAQKLNLLPHEKISDPLQGAKMLLDSMPRDRRNPKDFVRLVDTLIGIDLEKQTDEVTKRLDK